MNGIIIQLGGIHTADCKHGIKAPSATRSSGLQAVSFLAEIVQNILRYFPNPFWVQQSLLVLQRTELFLILLGFYFLKLRAHVVVVHFELEHFLIANGIRDHIRVQLSPKHAGRGFGTQGILRKDRCASKTKLIVAFKLFLQVLLRFAKLAAVTFIEDEHNLLIVNSQLAFALHQVIQLLNGGNDNLVIVFIQIALKAGGAVGTIHAIGREALIFLHGLIVKVFTVNHKEHLVDKV